MTAATVSGRAPEELTDHLGNITAVGSVRMRNFNYGDGHARGAMQGLTARGPVVVKDFAPRSALVRRILAPWLVDRELAAYARLAEVGAVPRVLGRLGRGAGSGV